MLIALLFLTISEGVMLWSTVVYRNSGHKKFQQIMSYFMSIVYALVVIMYIPLFATVMERLRL